MGRFGLEPAFGLLDIAAVYPWATPQVYNVSSFHTHPGGSLIFSHAGHDATGVFGGFHPSSAWDGLDRFLIGTLDAKPTPLEEDFRQLRATVRSMGLHKARCGRIARSLMFVAVCRFRGFLLELVPLA